MTEKELQDVMDVHDRTTPTDWQYFGDIIVGITTIKDVSSGEDIIPHMVDGEMPLDWDMARFQQYIRDLKFMALAHQAVPAMYKEILYLHGMISDLQHDGGLEVGADNARRRIIGQLIALEHELTQKGLFWCRDKVHCLANSIHESSLSGGYYMPSDQLHEEIRRLREGFHKLRGLLKTGRAGDQLNNIDATINDMIGEE